MLFYNQTHFLNIKALVLIVKNAKEHFLSLTINLIAKTPTPPCASPRRF